MIVDLSAQVEELSHLVGAGEVVELDAVECARCHQPFMRRASSGRPRTTCEKCRPSRAKATKA
jgi:hypothetical protein